MSNKPREFWIGKSNIAYNGSLPDSMGNTVHVIEYKAYEQVLLEQGEYKQLAEYWMRKYDKLKEKYEPSEFDVGLGESNDNED